MGGEFLPARVAYGGDEAMLLTTAQALQDEVGSAGAHDAVFRVFADLEPLAAWINEHIGPAASWP